MSETTNIEPTETKQSWKDKTLKAAGASYMVGDVAMAAAGLARGEKTLIGSIGGATTWFAGGLAAARYGNPDIEKQLQIQASKLEAHLKQNGVTIPDDARAQSVLLANKTVWGHVEQFMYEHPSELLNGMYAIGAGMLLHQSIAEDVALKGKTLLLHGLNAAAFEKLSSKFWIGALVGAGALTGLFGKEEKVRVDGAEHQGIVERAINFIKEKPLSASAGLYMASNGFLAWQAAQDFSARSGMHAEKMLKPHVASGLQLGAYLFANSMLFASSRNQITKKGFAHADMAKLENAAAAIIASQSPQTQQALLADISAFMATQKGVTLPAEKIAEDLATRVTELTRDRMQLAATNVKSFTESEIHRRDEAVGATPSVG